MALSSHTIKGAKQRKRKRVGRGNATQKGTYAGRGLKGQKSRSGGKGGTQRRGFKQSLQKVPKLRGFKSPHVKAQTVTLATLSRVAAKNPEITPLVLEQGSAIRSAQRPVKIVATGEIKTKVTITGCLATKSAVEQIEKAGGTIQF